MSGKGRPVTHGMAKNYTYKSWEHMKYRCDTPTAYAYPAYGGSGITYDPAWKSFEKFFEDMGSRPEGSSIDRIDSSKGYSKENCKWSTRKEQNMNRKGVVILSHNGVSDSMWGWHKTLKLSYMKFKLQIEAGKTIADILGD